MNNAPLGIALRRKGIMSLKRPAAGGESCGAGFFLNLFWAFLAKDEAWMLGTIRKFD